jgi:hypothetical protein
LQVKSLIVTLPAAEATSIVERNAKAVGNSNMVNKAIDERFLFISNLLK